MSLKIFMMPTEFLQAKYSSTNGQSCPAVRASGRVAYTTHSTNLFPSEKLSVNHPTVSKVALIIIIIIMVKVTVEPVTKVPGVW
jgi:hypothetical protein